MRKPFPYKVTSGWNSNRIGPNDHVSATSKMSVAGMPAREHIVPRPPSLSCTTYERIQRMSADMVERRLVAAAPRKTLTFYISSGLTTPITCPSGSLNWPSSTMSMIFSGPITRVPPRLSALASASSMSSTAT